MREHTPSAACSPETAPVQQVAQAQQVGLNGLVSNHGLRTSIAAGSRVWKGEGVHPT